MPVPRFGGLLEPSANLCWALRMLAVERAALEDALDGFGHVQPAAAERGVERHDAMLAKPEHHPDALVAGQVIPDEEHAQRRQIGRQGEALRQAILPSLPCGTGQRRSGWRSGWRHRRQDHLELFLEPAMQDGVGATADRLEVYLSRRGMEQSQDLAGATSDILVWLGRGVALRLPAAARLRYGLEQTSLVLAPDIEAEVARPPERARDGTATWSLVTRRDALRRAEDGLPGISTYTIGRALHALSLIHI